MRALVLVLFVVNSLALIGLILLQMSRHAGLGGAFGAGGSYTVFGREEKRDPKRTATVVLVTIWFVLAAILPLMH